MSSCEWWVIVDGVEGGLLGPFTRAIAELCARSNAEARRTTASVWVSGPGYRSSLVVEFRCLPQWAVASVQMGLGLTEQLPRVRGRRDGESIHTAASQPQ